MNYIENNLLSNEKIVYFTRMHWITFATPMILWVLTFAFFKYGPQLLPISIPISPLPIYQIGALICLVIAIFSSLGALIRYYTSEYGVTNKRVLIKVGWIRRSSLELFLDKVEAIYVDQSIPGRILGYGTLRIVGTGGTQDPFFYVPNPLKFRKIAQQQVDRGNRPPPPPPK